MTPPSPRDRFAWPPATPTPPDTTAPSPCPARDAPARPPIPWPSLKPRSFLETLEDAFLGFQPESLRRWAADAGWSPEPGDAACPTCVRTVGPGEVSGGSCPMCRGAPPKWAFGVRVGVYEGLLREAVLAAKYRASRRCAAELGYELGQRLSQRLDNPDRTVLVPIPTTARRRLERGIDHVALIARSAAKTCGGRFLHPLSRRHRPSQVRTAPSKRESNVRGSMRIERSVFDRYSTVVLVDDLMTTGATLREACRVIGPRLPKGTRLGVAIACVSE